eukprot:COSAG04_NODE_8916_length_917_cov_1.496333_1_plen_65_part_10
MRAGRRRRGEEKTASSERRTFESSTSFQVVHRFAYRYRPPAVTVSPGAAHQVTPLAQPLVCCQPE